MTGIYFIVAIAFLILIHEIGHYIAARMVGIPIQEFGIGFPPRAISLFTYKETEFTLNWIPLGGFVRPRERPEDENIPDELFAAAPWKRIFVYLAGPLMNIVVAIVILAGISYQAGSDLEHILITEVVSETPAEEAEMMVGDYILAVNDVEVDNSAELSREISKNLGVETEITLLRDETEFSVFMVPRTEHPEDEGPMGIGLVEPVTVVSAVVHSTGSIIEHIGSLTTEPGRFIGIKGLFDTFGAAVDMDQEQQDIPDGANTMLFVVSVSISLGLINLIPIPLFDGGKILLTIPEMIFRRRVPINLHYVLNMIGLGLVVMLMIYVNVQDFVDPIDIITPTP